MYALQHWHILLEITLVRTEFAPTPFVWWARRGNRVKVSYCRGRAVAELLHIQNESGTNLPLFFLAVHQQVCQCIPACSMHSKTWHCMLFIVLSYISLDYSGCIIWMDSHLWRRSGAHPQSPLRPGSYINGRRDTYDFMKYFECHGRTDIFPTSLAINKPLLLYNNVPIYAKNLFYPSFSISCHIHVACFSCSAPPFQQAWAEKRSKGESRTPNYSYNSVSNKWHKWSWICLHRWWYGFKAQFQSYYESLQTGRCSTNWMPHLGACF